MAGNNSNRSGLYKAILEGRLQQVKFYLESGVRLGKHGGNEENLLLASLHLEHEDKRRKIFSYLLHRGANYWDPDTETGRDILLWACYLDRTAQVKKLINYTVGNLNFATVDKKGYCPLHFAVQHGNINLTNILVTNFNKYGLTVDVPDKEGLTPLLHAKRLGFEKIADILVAEGGASTGRADEKSLGNVQEWKRAGKVQRNLEAHQQKENKRLYGKKLAINVLPQIDPRGLYRTKTTLWNRSKTKHVSIHPALATKSYSLPNNYRRNSIEKLRSILKYRPDEKTLMVDIDEVSSSSSNSELKRLMQTPVELRQHNKAAITTSINQIMSLLSEQISEAYRDPAVDEIRAKRGPTRMNALARISQRVKRHADEQEKRVKLKKELDRQTRLLKKKETFVRDVNVKRDKFHATKSREPSKIGLLPPITN